MSEFNFLNPKTEYKEIERLCIEAENAKESSATASKCREALCEIIKFIYAKQGIPYPETATMLEVIDGKLIVGFVKSSELLDSLHFIRKLGMNAEHGLHIKKTQAKLAFNNLVFFTQYMVYKFESPEKVKEVILPKYLSEAATRKTYIDLYLNEVGWEVMEPNSTTILPDGTTVSSGTVFPEKACAEIPVEGMPNKSGIGFCDYVLYGKNGKPLAIVEAKKASVEALVGQEQVKQYGECMEKKYGYMPVLYYTNGYEIYVMDGTYPARQIHSFHTLEELEYMIQKRERNDITDLTINDSISGRPYQKMAITNICERFNAKHRRGLIVMATGTGKTRVSISLVDVLLRNKWVKNVLFLADRTSLVEQAFKNFKKILPNMSYCVLSDRSLADEPNARITFSTHQTMIGFIDAENKEITSARYDLIIIDEAHRSIFNKYGSIFDYFDCLLVGLTATPKEEVDANTYQLFNCESGEPNFAYSLEEAVAEKYLVPYKVVGKTTKLLTQGIKYKDLSARDREQVETIVEEDITEDYTISKEKLFKIFYNEDTCRKVLEDLMENGLRVDMGQKIGKTIIFAYNHKHAELIVKVFNETYPQYGDNYCQLIDNQVKMANQRIEKFGTNDDFRIAVSVDMLDTGIDVPEVLNLVFFKPVKSKIKFVQMIGRGTRLCEGLIDGQNKKYFLIFDYCGNFEYFDENPEGASLDNGKSLSQKLFDIKLEMLVELQKYEHQSNPEHKAYYDRLKPELYAKIKGIKDNSKRISVRSKMDHLDKFVDYERWEALSILDKKEIQSHLSGLIDSEIDAAKGSLAFDMRMFQIELSLIATGKIDSAAKQVEKVRQTAKVLLEKASVTKVIEKADILNEIKGTQMWENPSVSKLEKYREDIRDLIQYIPPKHPVAIIDTEDEVENVDYTGNGLIDIRTYKEKVIDYLIEHTDNPTIKKIRNIEPINTDDVKELERILWNELGTKTEYEKEVHTDNLAAFIRSIVGVEQEAINEKFGQFLTGNVLNSQQQEFLKSIIDYVRENGDIQMEDIIEKSPFDNYDVLTLFGPNVEVIKQIVNAMHNSIMAA